MQVRNIAIAAFVAASAAAGPAHAADRLLHHAIDRTTGAIVRVFQTPSGSRVEVETPALKVQREISRTRVVTTIREASQDLTMSFERGVLSVSGPSIRITASRQRPERLEAARQLLAASSSVRHALALLRRLGFGPETPVLPLLVTTRAFLSAVVGDPAIPASAGLRLMETPKSDVRVIRASLAQETKKSDRSPTECWDAYAKEAIAAWIEYEDCMRDLRWWEYLDQAACATVYDMRALGAFSWWMRCVALG